MKKEKARKIQEVINRPGWEYIGELIKEEVEGKKENLTDDLGWEDTKEVRKEIEMLRGFKPLIEQLVDECFE